MRAAVLVCLGTSLLAGCCGSPLRVCTESRIAVRGPLQTQVTTDVRSTAKQEPLSQWTVDGGGSDCGGPKIALLDVDGLLVNRNFTGPYSAGENPVALFCERLDAIAADPQVCAVVVRINTPGGGVTASDLMWKRLQDFRRRTGRPVVACLMDVTTGGGYYLATAADEICAHPTTITGGIGVIFNHYILERTMEVVNIVADPIKAGEHVDMGTSLHMMDDTTKDWLQAMADDYHRRFKEVVGSSRPHVNPHDETTFDGRVFTAEQALERGLIDRIGYLEHAVESARGRAGAAGARVVMFHRRNDPAHTAYAITPNTPTLSNVLPLSVPGLKRAQLPAFLYLWQVEPTLEHLGE